MGKIHQDESGRSTTNRGKPPHKGGYSAKMKGINAFKVYFAETVIAKDDRGALSVVWIKAPCPWNPGKTDFKKRRSGGEKKGPKGDQVIIRICKNNQCVDPGQDRMYGLKGRVMNAFGPSAKSKSIKGYKCSCCGEKHDVGNTINPAMLAAKLDAKGRAKAKKK